MTFRDESRARGAADRGLAFPRYVVRVEPLAPMPPAELVDVLAPAFQRPLAGPPTA